MIEKIDWSKVNKIFFVGIKGVGMMPLSLIAKEAGFEVAGSDLAEEFITDEVLKSKEIKVYEGFEIEDIKSFFKRLPLDSCIVITTGAHSGYDNPQVVWAKNNNISILNQGQAVGIFMTGEPFKRELKGITVTGSHGKTTISAMLASAFSYLELDPSYSVGTSKIFPTGFSGHYGKGEIFIAEGDEYVGEPVYDRTPKIFYQKPNMAIINNIDFDHPDVYEDINDIKDTMLKFINNMQNNGKVFLNSDDKNLMELKDKIRKDLEVILYGKANSKYRIYEIESTLGSVKFKVNKDEIFLSDFKLSIPGVHNAHNALAVISVLDTFGIEISKIKESVSNYKGCKRRMELVGKTEGGLIVVDDYGHHPAEIRSTLEALKEFYGKKLVCVFQSHTYSRTKEFLDDFSKSFSSVEELILLPIFRSQRDTESDIISNKEFSDPFKHNLKKVYMANSIDDAVAYIKMLDINEDFVIVTIGAGDVYKVGYKLIK